MCIGAKLAVAPVARATPLFLPRPKIIYINLLHYSALPQTYLLHATPPLCPDWRHFPSRYPISIQLFVQSSIWLSYPMVIFSVNLFGLFKTCTYIYYYNHFNVVKEKSLKRKKVVIAWEYVDSILNLQKSGLSFSNHEISW